MEPVADEILMAWITGALEPGEAADLEDRLTWDRALRDRVQALRERLRAALAESEPDGPGEEA